MAPNGTTLVPREEVEVLGDRQITEDWEMLDPCPHCGSTPHEAPEGVKADGKPHWTFPHCWRCGFRPGVNQATDMAQLQHQFEEFKRYQKETLTGLQREGAVGLVPPSDPGEVAELKERLSTLEDLISTRRPEVPLEGTPFTPETDPTRLPDPVPATSPTTAPPEA